ncbi:MAG: signal recognition particle-docking protein FtsY [Actinomycetes bacterium]
MTLAVVLAVIGIVVVLSLLGALVVRARRGAASPPSVATPEPTERPPERPPPASGAAGLAGSVIAPSESVSAPTEPAGETPTYRERLGRSRGMFAALRNLGSRGALDEETLGELEDALLRSDVGVATTDMLVGAVRQRASDGAISDGDGLLGALRAELLQVLDQGPDAGPIDRSLSSAVDAEHVAVWLFVGVNGVGKTTTIGKLAAREIEGGHKVVLAAGDTFRAAAADQLGLWGQQSGAEVIRGAEGGDPSAVVFDAIARAKAKGASLVLADTAGRLHTKVNLIEELKKIRRVADRDPGDVTEVLLVLDATTGQNALVQARQFSEAVHATGVVLTKLDGTARGGVVIAIQRELGLPVKLVGLGEGISDLVVFDPAEFVDALLAPDRD